MQDSQPKGSRRGFFLAAGAAGAGAASLGLLAKAPVAEVPLKARPLPPPPDKGGGYSLSEHVQRYYKTTRV